ncbi:uncharacterized protein LOC62_03G004670 [Vanrija pseudolonga]|uniref:AAA protein C-terminal winged helix domain-containing protein n=1 Tax=Vanrija pseudolonga TaxID=143232 RepID=A0AAF0Y6H7_9TREE|nr:hypothetical protein LOC62_03G004670 [Vanrija pseudolonga]
MASSMRIASLRTCRPPVVARARALPLVHRLHTSAIRQNVPSWPPGPVPENPVTPSDDLSSASSKKKEHQSWWHDWLHSPSFQAALTTVVGLGMVFGAGTGYLYWYKAHVLSRVEGAFEGGYDPALELASDLVLPHTHHVKRREQPLIDAIFRGEDAGGYYLIIGPKGTGKGTMLTDAMRAIHAEGNSICEAHPDLEVFRLRLGKALDFDYFEDWQGSLFSRADPRNGGPSLDIERAMTKLEKVALKYARKNGRPLVMAFTNIHLFPNTEEGHAVLRQLQQRAEQWAARVCDIVAAWLMFQGMMTMVFTTDDFWCLDKMKKTANRMRILSVTDLTAAESISALRSLRRHYLGRGCPPAEEVRIESDDVLRRVYELVGGRTSFLARCARASNMIEEAETMIDLEKGWLLSKIGLIPEMDDDVMDEQKWASCSWLLLRDLADKGPALDPPLGHRPDHDAVDSPDGIQLTPSVYDQTSGCPAPIDDENESVPHVPAADLSVDVELPKVTFDDARRLMTRTDFFEGLDHDNIISIDVRHDVRPDNMLILRAAQQVVAEEDFDSMLDQTRDRVDEIEASE